jgi:hypothetical protein
MFPLEFTCIICIRDETAKGDRSMCLAVGKLDLKTLVFSSSLSQTTVYYLSFLLFKVCSITAMCAQQSQTFVFVLFYFSQ